MKQDMEQAVERYAEECFDEQKALLNKIIVEDLFLQKTFHTRPEESWCNSSSITSGRSARSLLP